MIGISAHRGAGLIILVLLNLIGGPATAEQVWLECSGQKSVTSVTSNNAAPPTVEQDQPTNFDRTLVFDEAANQFWDYSGNSLISMTCRGDDTVQSGNLAVGHSAITLELQTLTDDGEQWTKKLNLSRVTGYFEQTTTALTSHGVGDYEGRTLSNTFVEKGNCHRIAPLPVTITYPSCLGGQKF